MDKKIGWDYGYRSGCCYAPIKAGYKRIKNSKQRVLIWVCTRCKKRDVPLVDSNKSTTLGSSGNSPYHSNFIPDEPGDFREEDEG